MGRKRKAATPVKITNSPSKLKLEDSSDSNGDDPMADVEQPSFPEPQQEVGVIAQLSVPSNPGKKPWVEKCRQWVDEQQQVADPPPLEPDVDDEPPMDEPAELPLDTDRTLRQLLKDRTEKEILNSVMYECEWLKCGFETTQDLQYMTHVEAHVYRYLAKQPDVEDLVCFWDLCEFRTASPSDLESHVHFHVYHNRVKTHGASLSSIIHIPKCNGDSRRRNCIDSFKTKFRCEWSDCNERFNKCHQFFQHVNCHVQDQFPVDRKSTKQSIQCQWEGCAQMYNRSSIALEHMRKHSKERTIGCYTCGAIFVSRLKFIDHCKRQVEYHNREFRCTECDKLFATQQLMIDHRNIHSKKFACTQCPMKFPSRKALVTHIRYRHVAEKPLKCHLCNHRTVKMQDLDDHYEAKHNPDRVLLVCNESACGKTFKTRRSLMRHKRKVHSSEPQPVYSCHWCHDKTYPMGSMLSKHLVEVHKCRRKEGQVRFVYRIDESDGFYRLDSFLDDEYPGVPGGKRQKKAATRRKKTTVTKADLEEHVLTHDDRRMFRCEEFGCDATYKCQRSLKKHVDSIHYGAGPGIYACHLCASQYKAGPTLSKHLIRAHQFERPPGYNRFTYRANRHGFLQLSSATPNNREEPSPDGNQSPLPEPQRRRSAPIKTEVNKTEAAKTDDDASEPGPFPSFSIDKLEPVAKNTFSIELKVAEELPKPVYRKQTSTVTTTGAETTTTTSMDCETSDAQPLNMKIEVDEPSSSSVVSRNIDDFTVMKRYIKTEKPVVISYEEMDSSGSVIRSETVQTTELNREKLLQGNL